MATAIRTVMYGVGSALILAALAIMAYLQRRRLKFCRSSRETVVVTEIDTVEIEQEHDDG